MSVNSARIFISTLRVLVNTLPYKPPFRLIIVNYIILQLRDNAQKELKHIRDEVIDKKINATLVKKSLSLLETRSPNDV